jgi:L-ascorbate metabolism protein UlaG (beta-lactamase superfamily)
MAVQIRYLGWTTFQFVSAQGTKVVMDPFLAGDATRKLPPSIVTVSDLSDTDVITVTHAANDHYAQTVELMKESNATLFCGKDTYEKVLSANIPPERVYYMVPGVRFKFRDIYIKAIEASHISLSKLDGQWITGVPFSFIIEFGLDGKIFFSGDNALGLHYRFMGDLYRPDLAILGIGGVFHKGQYLTILYPDEAAIATKWLNVQAVIPMHYLGDEVSEFQRELKKEAPGVKLAIMKPGEQLNFSRVQGLSR